MQFTKSFLTLGLVAMCLGQIVMALPPAPASGTQSPATPNNHKKTASPTAAKGANKTVRTTPSSATAGTDILAEATKQVAYWQGILAQQKGTGAKSTTPANTPAKPTADANNTKPGTKNTTTPPK